MSVPDLVSTKREAGPRPPDITTRDLLFQFWADIYGKEVQSASTYSYTWMADQLGHVCIGILLSFGLTLAARYVLQWLGIDLSTGERTIWGGRPTWDEIVGFSIGSIGVSLWELSAYLSSVKTSTGLFPLDRKRLRNNAVIATAYMVMGLGSGFAFHQNAFWGVVGFLTLILVAILCAPPWLRQKIIWQKAALPYLFRLADVAPTVEKKDAEELQRLIGEGAPPKTGPRQIVIGGPIGSGRTSFAAGIGTEFAFRKAAVRYLSIDALIEFAARPPNPDFDDDTGPANINYWRWSEAQVVIIDNIGPLIATHEKDRQANLHQFRVVLDRCLVSVAPLLAKCHTVWVIGDLRSETAIVGSALNDFARTIAAFCQARDAVLVIELSEAQRRTPPVRLKPMIEFAVQPAQIRRITL